MPTAPCTFSLQSSSALRKSDVKILEETNKQKLITAFLWTHHFKQSIFYIDLSQYHPLLYQAAWVVSDDWTGHQQSEQLWDTWDLVALDNLFEAVNFR